MNTSTVQINNPYSLERFDTFNVKHHEILCSIPRPIESCDVNSIPRIILQDLGNLFSIDYFDSPYQMYPTEDGYYIIENISLIQSAQLLDDERDALIAHEIGHIVYSIEGLNLNLEGQEIFADRYAAKLGYKESLITALEKIVSPNNNTSIKHRICQLRCP